MRKLLLEGRRHRFRGAMLLEVAVVIVIVGVAVVALAEFMVSATRANSTLSDRTLALNIARAGQEWAASRTRPELNSLMGTGDYTPPKPVGGSDMVLVDSDPNRAQAYQGWSQTFSMEQINEADPAQLDVAPSRLVQITVKVSKGTQEQCRLSRLYRKLVD